MNRGIKWKWLTKNTNFSYIMFGTPFYFGLGPYEDFKFYGRLKNSSGQVDREPDLPAGL